MPHKALVSTGWPYRAPATRVEDELAVGVQPQYLRGVQLDDHVIALCDARQLPGRSVPGLIAASLQQRCSKGGGIAEAENSRALRRQIVWCGSQWMITL